MAALLSTDARWRLLLAIGALVLLGTPMPEGLDLVATLLGWGTILLVITEQGILALGLLATSPDDVAGE